MRVKIYYCLERESKSIISRHHLAPYAICEEKGDLSVDEVRTRVGEEIFSKLMKSGEVVIPDYELMKKFLEVEHEASYVKLILKT